MKLEHIQSLGVDSIWFSPFYEFEGADIGNDVKDHRKVDPRFGTEKDLDELFEEIRNRGELPAQVPVRVLANVLLVLALEFFKY